MTATSNSSEIRKRARRRRGWRIAFAVLVSSIAIQSITITLPIHGRVVDETSGQPVPRAAVAALWQLDAWTPVHVVLGGTVRMAETRTDEDGRFQFSTAFMVHLPLLPFSPLRRSDTDMPELIAVADGYHLRSASNDVFGIDGPRHTPGFLLVRTSSLHGAVLRVAPLPRVLGGEQRNEYLHTLEWAHAEVTQATGSCAKRRYCKSDSLAGVRDGIERGAARARSYK